MRIGEEIVKYGSAIAARSWSPRTITRRLVDFVVDQEMRRHYRALTSTAHLALLDALNDSEGAVMLITQDRSLIELVARRPLHPSRSSHLLVQPSQACTTVWRAILPPLSSAIAEQNTLVPSG